MYRPLLILILLAVVVVSCGSTDMRRRLVEIEDRTDTDPQGAYDALDDIDSTEVSDDDDKALYRLLTVRHNIKRWNSVSPGLLAMARLACDYYDTRGLSARQVDANQYMGCAYMYTGSLSSAIRHAMRALDGALELRDTLRMARAHTLMGDLYVRSHLASPELPHRMKAKELYNAVPDRPVYAAYSIIDLANCLVNNDFPDKAITLLDSNAARFDTISPRGYYYVYRLCYVRPLIRRGHYEQAKEVLFDLYKNRDIGAFGIAQYYDMVDVYLRQDSLGKAGMWFDYLKDKYTGHEYDFIIPDAEYRLACSRHDTAAALAALDTLLSAERRLFRRVTTDGLQDALAAYYRDRMAAETTNSRNTRLYLVALAIVLAVALGALAVLYIVRLRRRDIDLERRIDESRELRQAMEIYRVRCLKAQRKLDELQRRKSRPDSEPGGIMTVFSDIIKSLNNICEEYYLKKFEGAGSQEIRVDLERELDVLRSGDFYSRLEADINDRYAGLIRDIREAYPGMKEENLWLLMYHIIDFPPRTIAVLLNISVNSFYSRRKRMRNAFLASDFVRRDEIVEILTK